MKNRFRLIVSLCWLASPLFAQDLLQFFPEKPIPGEKVMLKYDLEQSSFEQIADVGLVVYLKEPKRLTAQEAPLVKQGNEYVAVINTTEQTKVVFARIQPRNKPSFGALGNDVYYTLVHDERRQQPVQGAYFCLGYALFYESGILGLEPDMENGEAFMEKEFERYPESKLAPDYMGPYASIFMRKNRAKAQTELMEVAKKWSKERKDEQKMTYAHSLYQQLGEKEPAQKLSKKIRKRFPAGTLVKNEIMDDFWAARGVLEAKEKAYARMERVMDPANRMDVNRLSQMAAHLATAFGQAGNWEKFDKYTHVSSGGAELASTLNNIAWGLAGQSLDRPAIDLEKADPLSDESLQMIKAVLENPLLNKPEFMTRREWLYELKVLYSLFSDTHALIQYKRGNYEAALASQEAAIREGVVLSFDYFERHAVYTEKVRGALAAEALLENYIRDNQATRAMKQQFKRLFMANNTLESAFDKYMSVLDGSAREEKREQLILEKMNVPAPDFRLTNLKGEIVQLSELEGKVVVLDFWASWCQPCIQSFSAMKKAVEKYSEEEVVFLFINSWETAAEKEKQARGFLEKYGFDEFNVPVDKEDDVIEAYQVTGIPTTFIIGPEGKIQFKRVGFHGEEERQLEELDLMIRLARQ
jgi:peroxiredoxin